MELQCTSEKKGKGRKPIKDWGGGNTKKGEWVNVKYLNFLQICGIIQNPNLLLYNPESYPPSENLIQPPKGAYKNKGEQHFNVGR